MNQASNKDGAAGSNRVRWTLLVLLWVWALLIFMVVDLFVDVEEFDRVRPSSRTYRGMRRAAHEMVGTPYRDPAEAAERRARTVDVAVKEGEKPEPRGRVVHRYLPRNPASTAARHGTYAQWTDPPGKGEGAYLDEMRHGTWVWRFAGGGVREERHYARGVLDGKVTEWYDGGRKKAEEQFALGKPVGVWRTWHPDGSPASEEYYEDGVLHGEIRHWHANGQLAAEATYEHGFPRGKMTLWHENGTVKETGQFVDGKRDGVWATYGPAGELVKQDTFHDGKRAD